MLRFTRLPGSQDLKTNLPSSLDPDPLLYPLHGPERQGADGLARRRADRWLRPPTGRGWSGLMVCRLLAAPGSMNHEVDWVGRRLGKTGFLAKVTVMTGGWHSWLTSDGVPG